jgi:hypothetical protein
MIKAKRISETRSTGSRTRFDGSVAELDMALLQGHSARGGIR